LLPQNPKTPWS